MADKGFSADEREAMKQRAEELRASKGLKGAAKLAREVEACVAAIDKLTGVDKEVAVLLNKIVTEEAPDLNPKTMYGFPSYARDGKVVVFYQPASKFKTRYGTVSFDDPGEPRRRAHVGGVVRGRRSDGCRGEEGPRARQEGGELTRTDHDGRIVTPRGR